MTLTLAALLTAAATSAAPSVFVLNPEVEVLVLEPRPGIDETATDDGEPPPSVAPAAKKGTAYRMVSLKGVGATVTTSADGREGENGCGGATRGLIAFSALPATDAPYVLVPGDWAAAPKTIIADDVTKSEYQPIVDAALAAHGVAGGKATAGVALKADIDGDGTDEIIVSATNVADGADKPKLGDFALIAVQHVKGGKPMTTGLLVQSIDKSNVEMADMPLSAPAVVAIADLDGDKRMEIVTLNIGYEEHSVDAWHVEEDATKRIPFQAYCGV